MASSASPATSFPSPLRLGPLIMGGAGFSYQLTTDPSSLPAASILSRAFSLGIRTIDTSPYYHPSEEILGAALSSPEITSTYSRADYILMTKCGRLSSDKFDYSPSWIHASVTRSLSRFQTSYLDVVFCHDVEYVSVPEAVGAVGALFELKKAGKVRYAGISGYDLDVLVDVAVKVRETYGMPVDVVQSWAQLTLQNTRLEKQGLGRLREAGVRAVCSSSPLACGLLRDGGVPVGALGDWHPAPEGLRERAKEAAEVVHGRGQKLAAVALRFAIRRTVENSRDGVEVATITGIGSLRDLEENVETARQVLGDGIRPEVWREGKGVEHGNSVDRELQNKDELLFEQVRNVLGSWVDYDFSTKS